jgi:hypothetical protein
MAPETITNVSKWSRNHFKLKSCLRKYEIGIGLGREP